MASIVSVRPWNQTTGGSPYNAGSVPVASGKLYYAAVFNALSTGATAPTSIGGGGLITWTKFKEHIETSGGQYAVSAWRGVATGTGTISNCPVAWSANQQSACGFFLELDGPPTTNDGADSFLQATGADGNDTTPSVTLPDAFASASNGVVGFLGSNFGTPTTAFTPEADYTEILEEAVSGPSINACAIWRASNDATPGASIDFGSGLWFGIALELVLPAPSSIAAPAQFFYRRMKS